MVEASRPIPRLVSKNNPERPRIKPQAAADRHAEPPVPDGQHLQRVQKRQDHVGQHLADHQLPWADGGDDELLDGATLALAHDGGGGQDGGQRKQDHADHARDHEIGADQVGVVPDLGVHFQRRL